MSTVKKKKIAILGGGPAAMAAAFELTDRPDWRDRFEITVYQVGWRLGGKCASGRNPRAHERIEEHGLHVLMGFYENTFRLIRGCYDELARRGLRRPGDPLATWQEALKPQSFVVLEENVNGRWIHWPFDFGVKPGLPGDDPGPRDAWDVILDILTLMGDEFRRSREARRPARLLGRIIGTIAGWVTGLLSPMRLASDSPAPPGPAGLDTLPEWLRDQVRERVGAELTNIDLRAEDGLLEIARRIARRTPGGGALEPRDRPGEDVICLVLGEFMRRLWQEAGKEIARDDRTRRLVIMMSLGYAIVRGIFKDGVLKERDGRAVLDWRAIDDYDLRDWLRKHLESLPGSPDDVINSAPVRGVYDLVFGYRGGVYPKPGVPGNYDLAAGTALDVMLRLVLTYKGAVYWKMQAGMGDVVLAPFYEVLRGRGVRFEFFHRVKNLGLSPDKGSVASILLGRQVTLKNGEYQPLVRIKGLPCWPSEPVYEYLDDEESRALQDQKIDLESHWTSWQDREEITLKAGEDFDAAILAISIGALPHVCPELIRERAEWREMVARVLTVQTQAVQLWLRPDLSALGWRLKSPVMDGYGQPYNAWADMTDVVAREDWPHDHRPGSLAYLCGPLEDAPVIPPADSPGFAAQEKGRVERTAVEWLKSHCRHLWPEAILPGTAEELNWDLLIDPEGSQGQARFKSQYYRANINPSDRYVLSVKGSSRYRLRPDESGLSNLYLAGDWTDNGINVGCVEAAIVSGVEAARSIRVGGRVGGRVAGRDNGRSQGDSAKTASIRRESSASVRRVGE